ncbi:MAG: class II glutamine amidotransferase [Polyangiales bacterium]
MTEHEVTMCELLGMVASQPADVVFSFTGLALRGGQTGPHADGWGLALYDGMFARLFLEEHPAYSSPLARFLRENPILAQLAVAHVRKMTRGTAAIENTHPFVRVVNGRHIVFAHNGTLPHVRERPLRHESTLGNTDSEHAFCVILEELRERFGPVYPDEPQRLGDMLFEVGNALGQDGVFNFLYADGRHLFARCGDSLYATVRRAPFREVTLVDAEVSMNFGETANGGHGDLRMAAVATTPLTRNETWIKGTPGTLWQFTDGDLVQTWQPAEGYAEANPKIVPDTSTDGIPINA